MWDVSGIFLPADSFIASMGISSIDLYHFVPLSVALAVGEGHEISKMQSLFGLLLCSKQKWMTKWYRLAGLVVKASISGAEDQRFESYQWLKHWHSSGFPARHLAL